MINSASKNYLYNYVYIYRSTDATDGGRSGVGEEGWEGGGVVTARRRTTYLIAYIVYYIS